jgi:acyl-homoserine-lactone acylase
MASKTVTRVLQRTTAPSCASKDGKVGRPWRLMNEPLKALTQSYHPHQGAQLQGQFYKAMELRTNSSNNTVYADADGNIAYFHGNFIPRARSVSSTGSKPVDGSDPATEWKGLHAGEGHDHSCSIPRTAGSRTRTTGRSPRPAPYSPKVRRIIRPICR